MNVAHLSPSLPPHSPFCLAAIWVVIWCVELSPPPLPPGLKFWWCSTIKMQCNYRQYWTAENKPAKIQPCVTLRRRCGCQSLTPGDNLVFLRSNNWAFRMCHSYELVKSLFAAHPGAPDGLNSPCSSSGAASFTLQAFSSSCTCKFFFWQLLCIRAPCLNLSGEVREEGWGRACQTKPA